MTYFPAAIAWAGAAVAVAAALSVWVLLRRFMAGPPKDEATQGPAGPDTQAAIQQALAAERAGQRHWGAGGKS